MTFHLDDFLHEKITIPTSVEEQSKIARALETCDREIELLQKQLDALKEQKRGLMQIYLNPELILAPPSCIDYVVTHELCHLVHPHHGREFYALLRNKMPDWEGRRARSWDRARTRKKRSALRHHGY